MPVDAESLSDTVRCLPFVSPLGNFLANLNADPRPANLNALGLGSGHTGLCSLADFLRLNLCQGREKGEQNIADQFVICREVGQTTNNVGTEKAQLLLLMVM